MLEITKASMIHFFNEYQLEWDDEKRLKFMKQAETYRIYDKETLGYFQIRENSDILYLYDIQILPPYRKKGIGRKIVNYVINVARERHCDKINLAVFKSSPAINLYQKSGFKIFEETEAVYRMEKLIM
ncbi:MAG: GNAT family N-acetyltransferase [Desulfobacteraceae bacterium]|nr:GNAT family N-acetyltransferase [Desulfobacteraceae bacterium]